ncbi:hypothetical protein D9758_007264 [Tetrapyrgos nigripes]|uniref:Uncharacterized protein n=1 Tax=Tetrapyrgos nigripes TaxID=182062 RepID=A0A8H5D3M3_9AGAR|nr:hypothetical protein D9758_007264 [Tetrapyrgos nigripes]
MSPSQSRGHGKLCLDSHAGFRDTLQSRQNNAQTSLTLDPAVIANGFSDDGQDPPVDGETRSLTSSNNFINYCALFNLPLTNGTQNSRFNATCNPVPMGALPSVDHMPSSKIRFPLNGNTLTANQDFTISVKINNLNTGVFTVAEVNYLSAPQQLDGDGLILGHGAVVIEQLDSLRQIATTTPGLFSFYKSLNIASQAGVVNANVDSGLPSGFYRLSAIVSAANHQPVLVPVVAHGAIDDFVYFSVTSDGKPPTSLGSQTARDAPESDVVVDLTNTGTISLQSIITVDSSVIGNFTDEGPRVEGSTPSLTSTNNYINFCLNFPSLPLTNGKISVNASCNPAPMGLIVPESAMPSVKFLNPQHMDNIPANSTFTVQLKVSNMETGVVTNADKTYLSAPQQINEQGQVLGHAHIVIEELTSMTQDDPTNPKRFAFFAELGDVAKDRVLEKNVTEPSTDFGTNFATWTLNDMVYFTVGNGGDGSTSANTLGADAVSTSTSTTASSTNTGSPNSPVSSSRHMNIGAIAGGTAAGVIAIALFVGFFLFHRRRRLQAARQFTTDNPVSPSSELANQITPFSTLMSASNTNSTAGLVSQPQAGTKPGRIPPVPVIYPAGNEKSTQRSGRRGQTDTSISPGPSNAQMNSPGYSQDLEQTDSLPRSASNGNETRDGRISPRESISNVNEKEHLALLAARTKDRHDYVPTGTHGNIDTIELDSSRNATYCFLSLSCSRLPKTRRSFNSSAQKSSPRSDLQGRQNNPQTSLTLDPAVIADGSNDDGQSPPVDGETRSLTSSNNFINYCALFNLPLTNGTQHPQNASCNPVPMGVLPNVDLIPASKFSFPLNGDTLRANQDFTISVKINNLNTGIFTSADVNYLSAPQQLDEDGQILGHGAVVIDILDSFRQNATISPEVFAFYKSLTIPSQAGVVDAVVSLPPGFYRLTSILSAANHQPVLTPVLAHGAIDDVVYFSVTTDGKPPTNLGFQMNQDARESDVFIDLTSTERISLQSLDTLDASVIGNFTDEGPLGVENHTPSLISTNNYINFCLNFPSLPLANGKISFNASCNPTPMGLLVPGPAIPSIKFQFPRHLDNVPSNSTFTVRLKVSNLQTGIMTNPDKTYLSAPQQINTSGQVLGHVHLVIDEISSLTQDVPTNPRQFAFYAELGEQAQDGLLEKNVTLPDGVYRLSATSVAANHQPVLATVLQHGSSNDMVYFTVGNGGEGSISANTLSPGGGTGTTITFNSVATSTTTENSAAFSGSSLSPSPNQSSLGSSGSHLNIGAVVGGAVVGAMLLGLLLGFFLFRRRYHAHESRQSIFDNPASSSSRREPASQITPFPISTSVSNRRAHDPTKTRRVPPVPGQYLAHSLGKSARGSGRQDQIDPISPPALSNDGTRATSSSGHPQISSLSEDHNGSSAHFASTHLILRRDSVLSESSQAPSYHTNM